MVRRNIPVVLLFTLLPVMSWAQTVEDDFEGNGTITTWFGDGCQINRNLPNPFSDGINTSATVLEYNDTGGQYANVRFDAGGNFDLSTNHTFSMSVYVPSGGLTGSQANQVSVKLQNGNLGSPWSTQSEIIKSISLDQWQSVTFDFENDAYINLNANSSPPVERTDFNRIVIQMNGEDNTDHVVAYLDDFNYDGTVEVETDDTEDDPVFDQLVWADEFDENGAINAEKWFHQTQIPSGGSWYNGEIQHYTDRLGNTTITDGVLSLKAIKESFTDQGVTKNYTSARLNSKFAFTYGRMEVRAKLPSGVGTWPAIWLLGKNINEDGGFWDEGFGTTPWPQCGEIDVMEHWGDNQNYVQSATHTPSSFGGTVNHGGQTVPTASDDFHVYTLDWFENKLVFSVDDVIHYTYKPSVRNADTWPFSAELYILLNVAILPEIATNITESAMDIDYVRIYQEEDKDDGSVLTSIDDSKDVIAIYPNPTSRYIDITIDHGIPILSQVFDVAGNLVLSIKNSTQLDLNGIHSGVYLLKIHKSDGHSIIRKVIVEK